MQLCQGAPGVLHSPGLHRPMDTERVIIHFDVDAFYAQVRRGE